MKAEMKTPKEQTEAAVSIASAAIRSNGRAAYIALLSDWPKIKETLGKCAWNFTKHSEPVETQEAPEVARKWPAGPEENNAK